MPRDIDATFTSEKNKQTNQPLFLYILHKYDGTKDLKLAEYDTDIIFNDETYSSFPITHEFIGENTSGEIDAVKIRLANVSRLIQAYIESDNYEFRGLKVTIRRVWADQLLDTDAYIDDIYYIDEYTADQNNVEFTLTGKFDVLDVTLPFRKYTRNYCQWKFKSTECGYTGSETTCNKTLAKCREYGNQIRIGAFPSIPSKRIFNAW